MRVPAYTKTIVALVAATITVVTPLVGDGVLTTSDFVQVAVALLGALGVYALPNAPVPGQWRQDPETGTEYKV